MQQARQGCAVASALARLSPVIPSPAYGHADQLASPTQHGKG